MKNETTDTTFKNKLDYGRPGLTLRQIKHVLSALSGKGAPQQSGNKTIYFINHILRSKSLQKSKTKCRKNEIKH